MRLLSVAVSTIVAICGCSLSTAPSGVSQFGSGSRRILFIGNSLIGANDLGAMVAVIAESARVSPLPSVTVDWAPDYALIDHWNGGGGRNQITSGRYDIVVMQQGPSSVDVNRDTLRLAAGLFAPVIRSAGGVPALLSVWPTIDRQVDWDRATESYRIAAQDVRGYMLPGGEVWRAAWKRNPNLQFYSDGLHPSPLGSYAVALSIVSMLYDRTAVGLASTFRLPGGVFSVSPDVARVLQESADSANRRFGFRAAP
jgi:hypothetical protein